MIKLRCDKQDDERELRILIMHPMENGRNRDENNQLIPAHYIDRVEIWVNQIKWASMYLGPSISKNPFFTLKNHKWIAGDRIRVFWVDNWGVSDDTDFVIPE